MQSVPNDHSTNLSGYSSDDNEDKHLSAMDSYRCKAVEVNGIILRDYMGSSDLNECVAMILKKEKHDQKSNPLKVIRYNPSGKEKEKRRRQRKNKKQFDLLQVMYDKDPFWDKPMIKKLSKETGLKEAQIYKWNWDQRKKNNLILKNEESMNF